MKKVSVILPTKNEPYVQTLINKIHKTLKKFNHEIIVVDKSDKIPTISNAKLVLQKSDGLGKAIIEGLKYSKGDIIVTMDADGSHRPKDIPKLLEKIKNYDIVIGSRHMKGGTMNGTFRKIVSKIFCLFAAFVLRLKIKDSMSGFSVIKREVYERIKPNPIGFKINLEILWKAKKFGFKSIEVPIKFLRRKAGKPKGGIKEGLKTLLFILKLRLS
jgi:dolichol-phosphate mannosyltransferase